MSRTSAHSIKNKGSCPKQDKPREGTTLRSAYDTALTGDWFTITQFKDGTRIRQMLEEYDLEIISKPDPSRAGHSKLYRCVGIWHGADLLTLEDVREALANQANKDQV